MPNTRIGEQKRKQVIKLWLLGTTRAEIHRITGISSGAVSNIIADFKKRLDGYDPEALKDLCTKMSEENTTPSQSATGFRVEKMINEMGGDEEEIEAFLSDLQKECTDKNVPPSAIVPSLQVASEFSEKEGISISEVPSQLENRKTELAKLRADTDAAKVEKKKALEDAKLSEEIVRDFIQLEFRLNAVGLTTKNPDAIVNVAFNIIIALGGDPKKIVAQFSKINSFESVERRHQQKCAYWEDQAKLYSRIYELAHWFVLNGYMRIDLQTLQDIIVEIARREAITPAQAKGRLFMAIISYAARDGLVRQVNSINGGIFILEKERNRLLNSLANYRYLVDVIDTLVRQIGITETKAVVDAMCEILTSPHYRSNPQALNPDLKELIKRRREEQLQKREELSKPKDENDERPSSAAIPPALPERIQKPEGDSPDQCRKEEGAAAAAAGGGNNTHEITTTSNAQEQEHDNQENDRSKSPA
jgi:hypothetical protein